MKPDPGCIEDTAASELTNPETGCLVNPCGQYNCCSDDPNKVFNLCGTACKPTCEEQDASKIVCTKQCLRGCECRDGLIETDDGKCISPNKCPKVPVALPPVGGDHKPPVIKVSVGDMKYYVTAQEEYTDLGATCHDLVDGSLSVEVSGQVNLRKRGTYIIHYSCTDTAGNVAEQTRFVLVLVCPQRRKRCPDGETSVGMVAELHESIHCIVGGTMCQRNKCVFEECPLTKKDLCEDELQCPSMQCDKDYNCLNSEECPLDVKKCPDGTYVKRDPVLKCNFKPCVRVCCKALTAQCLACSQDVSVHEYCQEHPRTVGCKPRACTKDAKRCPDGSFVGRDPYNNCRWHECPKKDDGEDKPPPYKDDTTFKCPGKGGNVDYRDDSCTEELAGAPLRPEVRFVEADDDEVHTCANLIDSGCFDRCKEGYERQKNAQWIVMKCKEQCKKKTDKAEPFPLLEYSDDLGTITKIETLHNNGAFLPWHRGRRLQLQNVEKVDDPSFSGRISEINAEALTKDALQRTIVSENNGNKNVVVKQVKQVKIDTLVTDLNLKRIDLCFRRITLKITFFGGRQFLIYLPRICRHCYSEKKALNRHSPDPGYPLSQPPQGGDRYLIALHGETRQNCGGRKCKCYDGTLTCADTCSKRREYNMLGIDSKGYDEKQLVIDAIHWVHDHCDGTNVKCGTFDGTTDVWDFKESIANHLWYSSHAHGQSKFLPWHRQYLWELEQKMQIFHQCVTLPYWDWTKENGDNPGEHIFDANYFGLLDGDQSPPSGDLGQFKSVDAADPNYYLVPGASYHSQWNNQDLDRNGGSAPAPSTVGRPLFATEAEVAALLTVGTYSSFRSMLEGGPHVPPHTRVGGEMGNYRSPGDPLFWLHHAMTDKIWYDWQYQNGGSNLYAYDSATTANLSPQWDRPVSDMFDSKNDVKVCYQDELVPRLGEFDLSKWDLWRRIVPFSAGGGGGGPDCVSCANTLTLQDEDKAWLDMAGLSVSKAKKTWCLLRNVHGTSGTLDETVDAFLAHVQNEYSCSTIAEDYNKEEGGQSCCTGASSVVVPTSLLNWLSQED